MEKKLVRLALAFGIFGITQSGIIDRLHKCPIKDSKCQGQLFQDMLHEFGATGIPELGIPSYDPIHLINISVPVLNLVNVTLVNGIAKGVKDCIFEEFMIDFEKGIGKQKVLCNIVIKGHYKVSALSPIIGTILGGSELHGEGKAKVKIEKLRIEFNYPLTIQRHNDGDVYIFCKVQEIQRKFDLIGKVTFAANNIFFGKEDVSELIINIFNQNYKHIMEAFGQPFYDKAGGIIADMVGKFFDYVPAKHYIIEDMTPYLTD